MKLLATARHEIRPELNLTDYPFTADPVSWRRGQIVEDEADGEFYAIHSETGQGRLAATPEGAIRSLLDAAGCTDIEVRSAPET